MNVIADAAALVECDGEIQAPSVKRGFEPDRAGAKDRDAANLGLGHGSLLFA
jgi:hypothetical protein